MICARPAVQIKSFSAILFLASSLLNTRQIIQTVAGAGYKPKTTESDSRNSFVGTNNYQTGELSSTLDSSTLLSSPPEEGAPSAGRQTENRPRFKRPAAAGKIFDYLTTNTDNESKVRHHLLKPRLAINSTAGLMRLVAGPFRSAKTIASRSAQDDLESSRSFGEDIKQVGEGFDKDKSKDENSLEDSHSRKCDGELRPGGYRRIFREYALTSYIKAARNLLTRSFASIEQRAGGLFSLGSGLLATLIPLASLISANSGPQYQFVNSSEMAAQTSNSSVNSSGLPSKLAHYMPDSSVLQNKLEFVLGLLERSSQKLPTFPNLHPSECIKRSVCEAHYEPKRYGAIGLMLRTMFPAAGDENMEQSTVLNKYRRAGEVGERRRRNNTLYEPANENPCREKYQDCSVSLLDVAKQMVDSYLA